MKAGAYDQAKQDALARTKRRKHDPGDKNWVYNVWTKPMPLLSELMIGGGCLGLPTSKNRANFKYCWSATSGRRNGVFRRVGPKPHMSSSEIAAKEAFEEAGVIGYISPNLGGMFRARKQSTSGLPHQIIDVWVYCLK
jgi:hypothetical protein